MLKINERNNAQPVINLILGADMPKTSKHAMAKILERAEQMATELTQFARDELLLGFGERLRVTIEIYEDEAVDFYISSADDKVYDVVPSSDDWNEILALPWNSIRPRAKGWRGMSGQEMRNTLLQIQRDGRGVTLESADALKINTFLQKQGGKFKMVNQGSRRFEPRIAR